MSRRSLRTPGAAALRSSPLLASRPPQDSCPDDGRAVRATSAARVRCVAPVAATTRLWVTILLAVLTPVFTLIGIFWTQRTADRRAERDAALRLQNQRATDEEARLIEVYREVNAAKARAIQTVASSDHVEWQETSRQLDLALFSANMFAPAVVIQSLYAFRRLVNERRSAMTVRAVSAQACRKPCWTCRR